MMLNYAQRQILPSSSKLNDGTKPDTHSLKYFSRDWTSESCIYYNFGQEFKCLFSERVLNSSIMEVFRNVTLGPSEYSSHFSDVFLRSNLEFRPLLALIRSGCTAEQEKDVSIGYSLVIHRGKIWRCTCKQEIS
jgi:hypothetical protein